MSECEHSFVFLRQEERDIEYPDSGTREWKLYDVFFCQKCLHIQSIHVQTEIEELKTVGVCTRRSPTWKRSLAEARGYDPRLICSPELSAAVVESLRDAKIERGSETGPSPVEKARQAIELDRLVEKVTHGKL